MYQIHFHRRNLPHIYRPNSTYFITFRLNGSLARVKINELRNREEFNKEYRTKRQKTKSYEKYFEEYDQLLDKNRKINYLKNPQIADIVKKSLHFYDKKEYNLICFSIMPNHVHIVFHLLDNPQTEKPIQRISTQTNNSIIEGDVAKPFYVEEERISKIMQSIKGYSAREANRILNKKGSFWQSESYDHIVRDEDELVKIINYVINNPVKSNLAENWKDWGYTYLADDWQ